MLVKKCYVKTQLQHSKEPEEFSPSLQQFASGAYAEPAEQIHNFVICLTL
jgi:hypothetical protein